MATPVYDQADHFLIPLLDGGFGLGQVLYPGVAVEEEGMYSAPLCMFTGRRMTRDAACTPVSLSEVLAVELVDPAPLRAGIWPVIGFEQLPPLRQADELRRLSDRDGGTARVCDTGLIEASVNACHGLYPWDGFGGNAVFDALLRPGVARPV